MAWTWVRQDLLGCVWLGFQGLQELLGVIGGQCMFYPIRDDGVILKDFGTRWGEMVGVVFQEGRTRTLRHET